MSIRHLLSLLSLSLPAASFAGELPDALVEKILGISGVHHEAGKYVKLDLVYKDSGDHTVFTLRVTQPGIYDQWKSASADNIEAVPGVGDDAFTYKRLGGLCARTAKTAACVTVVPLPGRPKLSSSQLADLVRAAL